MLQLLHVVIVAKIKNITKILNIVLFIFNDSRFFAYFLGVFKAEKIFIKSKSFNFDNLLYFKFGSHDFSLKEVFQKRTEILKHL